MGKGYKIAIEILNEGRIGIAAQMLGLARGVFDKAVKYTYDRKQFGKPVGEFQAMQVQMAEAAIKIEGVSTPPRRPSCRWVASDADSPVSRLSACLCGASRLSRPPADIQRCAPQGGEEALHQGGCNGEMVRVAGR